MTTVSNTHKTLADFINDAKSRITEVDIDKAEQLIIQGYKVLDVREPQEYETSNIKGSINIPRGTIEPAADFHFEGANPILRDSRNDSWLVLCATGGRAALATDTLQHMGFTDIMTITGGMTAWENAGKELNKPNR